MGYVMAYIVLEFGTTRMQYITRSYIRTYSLMLRRRYSPKHSPPGTPVKPSSQRHCNMEVLASVKVWAFSGQLTHTPSSVAYVFRGQAGCEEEKVKINISSSNGSPLPFAQSVHMAYPHLPPPVNEGMHSLPSPFLYLYM